MSGESDEAFKEGREQIIPCVLSDSRTFLRSCHQPRDPALNVAEASFITLIPSLFPVFLGEAGAISLSSSFFFSPAHSNK